MTPRDDTVPPGAGAPLEHERRIPSLALDETQPPEFLPVRVELIPDELRRIPQWVVWRPDLREGKWTKVPYDAKRPRKRAKSTDPKSWTSIEKAVEHHSQNTTSGIGFVFTAEDPYVGVDLDKCRDPNSGVIDDRARKIISQLDSYTEVSPSGTGVKIYVRGKLPGTRHRTGNVEMYEKSRYFVVTGHHVPNTPTSIEDRTERLAIVYGEVFDSANDDALIARARKARNGRKFEALWSGDTAGYESQSEADLALCSVLSFYTGNDPARIDRLFRRSRLFRPKWDEPHSGDGMTYGAMTIAKAHNGRTSFCNPESADGSLARFPGDPSGSDRAESGDLPAVILPGKEIKVVDAAVRLGELLGATGRLFNRGGVVVALKKHNTGVPSLEVVKPAALPATLETVARLFRLVKARNGDSVPTPCICAEKDARLLMGAEQFRAELPPVLVITRCPVLIERNGTLKQVSGYDRESGILAGGRTVPKISLDQARERLAELLRDFKFATLPDRSRALAALITPALVFSGLLPGRAPLDVGEADASQTGKGYRNKLTAAVYRSRVKTVAVRKGGVGSIDESFDTALVSGANFICFDNIRNKLDSQTLESFLTEDQYLARVPYSGSVEIDPTRTIVMLTSNRAELTKDLGNRSAAVVMQKQPDGRQFRSYPAGGLLEHVRANSEYYLAAVFAVVHEWHSAGRPRSKETRHDFRGWAQTMDWIVQNLLCAAPLIDGHAATKQRMTSQNLTWMRDVAFVVANAKRAGDPLLVNDLLDLMVEASDVEIPGSGVGADFEDESTRKAAWQGIGRRLGSFFRDSQVIEIDGMTITRSDFKDGEYRTRHQYTFEIRNDPAVVGHHPTKTPPVDPAKISADPANPTGDSEHSVGDAGRQGEGGVDENKMCRTTSGVSGVLAGDVEIAGQTDDWGEV